MDTKQAVIEKLATLAPEKQQEVLDFVEFLQSKTPSKRIRRSPKGLCADLKMDLTDEELQEARREMWRNFPREDLLQ